MPGRSLVWRPRLQAILCGVWLAVPAGCSRARPVQGPGDHFAAEAAGPSDELRDASDFIEKTRREDRIPSVAVAVARGGSVVWEQGFGEADRERHLPATPHTLYGLASVTKTITASALGTLRDRGALDLDRPVNDYLGGAKLWSPRWDAAATVRRVANHTAGLASYDSACYADEPDCDRSRDEMIRRYGAVFWRPGDHFDYSNLGYGILGEIVAHLSGRTYFEAVKDAVFDPLGMAECAPDLSAGVAPHYEQDGPRAAAQEELAQGASSLACSADALIRFGMFHLEDDAMTAGSVEADGGLRYALGWWIDEHAHRVRLVFASGGTTHSGALLYLVPSQPIAIAVLVNGGTPRLGDIADHILAALLPGAPSQQLAGEPPPQTDRLAELAGTWTGAIHTYAGDQPVTLLVSAAGSARVSIGQGPLAPAERARWTGRPVLFRAHGDVGTPDANRRRPYRLGFELYPDDDRLEGAVTTWQEPGARGGGVLSYPVTLTRAAR